ncbi:hypothetical protein [Flavobacterium sp.]|uniref:hypothetical protein n=1 Tax=Flavobacterium sp. TaxID=239 RepID=UPI00120E7B28|nr:hypothetical protein [Flavobacterium sp.]RZJ69661.1 MAG: hypothetical protein EOO49_16660 [Flavobacterium sp.]
MPMQVCSCEGLNPDCPKCFGSGYAEVAETKGASDKKKNTENKPSKRQSSLPEDLLTLTKKEIEHIALQLVEKLDLKSKKQIQLLNSIPFSTNTFRIVSKDKFANLAKIENEKRFLRGELDTILKETAAKKYFQGFQFGHFLSDKEIDISSNRQLKTLLREYKKLKTK